MTTWAIWPGPPSLRQIFLKRQIKKKLRRLVRAGTTENRMATRARVVLMRDDGLPIEVIVRRLEIKPRNGTQVVRPVYRKRSRRSLPPAQIGPTAHGLLKAATARPGSRPRRRPGRPPPPGNRCRSWRSHRRRRRAARFARRPLVGARRFVQPPEETHRILQGRRLPRERRRRQGVRSERPVGHASMRRRPRSVRHARAPLRRLQRQPFPL
jgi:hypothetical protein